jgi:hypothetical protein
MIRALGRRTFAPLAILAAVASSAFVVTLSGCEVPVLTRDGQLQFPQKGARGAAVFGANGVEFHDRDEIPRAVVVRDVDEPFRTPIGFILPASGVFSQTSTPVVKTAEGIALVVRSSDTRVPTWGGEILVRVDLHAVSNEGARAPLDAVIVLEGIGDDTPAVVEAALSRLGSKDTVTIIDAHGPRVVVPPIPATHRALALAAIAHRISSGASKRDLDFPAALEIASAALDGKTSKNLLIVTGAEGEAAPKLSAKSRASLASLAHAGVHIGAVAASSYVVDDDLRARVGASGAFVSTALEGPEKQASIATVLPASGPVLFSDVVVDVQGVPAPTHVLETSGPEPTWTLDGGSVAVGDLAAGVLSAEVYRVSVPAWVPGAAFNVTLRVDARDARTGILRTLKADLKLTYDDDIERIAESRAGDVIAYASALATMDRMQAAFIGDDVRRAGGLRQLAEMQVHSLSLLARDFPDRGFTEDASVLAAMLAASR